MIKNIRLAQLSPSTLEALSVGDIGAAGRAASMTFGACFVSREWRRTWRRRLAQLNDDQTSAAWITRAIVDADCDLVVGRAGFHGPPDPAGMVEIGYAVDPVFRRRGYARAALVALLEWAKNEPAVTRVRATVRPDNLASLRLIGQYGFVAVGEQWDDEDGLETIFEVDAGAE